MAKVERKKWAFAPRFRRNAFGWRSHPAIERVKQAVSEIKSAARIDPILGAEGAVLFLERVSPALAQVDSSSGAIGTAVNHAIRDLVPIIADAPADENARDVWLERLWEAHEADEIPYIESLADYWGELCASQRVASAWADRLLGLTRLALSPDKTVRGHFHGTSACLSALFFAGRHAEVVDILAAETFWPYKRWTVKALTAMGKGAEAIRSAESCRGPWASDQDIDSLCEELLLSSGFVDEAYRRYGLTANRAGTYIAWFRTVARKYPDKKRSASLVEHLRFLGRPQFRQSPLARVDLEQAEHHAHVHRTDEVVPGNSLTCRIKLTFEEGLDCAFGGIHEYDRQRRVRRERVNQDTTQRGQLGGVCGAPSLVGPAAYFHHYGIPQWCRASS